jgi:hypothetical protein
MNTATHSVAALSPEAFASIARSPFPCAPRYGREILWFSPQGLLPSVRRVCARVLDSTLQALEFLDVCTLVLLPKGAFLWNPPKHDSVVKCATAVFSPRGRKVEIRSTPAPNKERYSHPPVKTRGLSRARLELLGGTDEQA